jgi:hypothetical protein
LPASSIDYAIAAQWTDLRTDGTSGAGTNGIFTSVSGSAPHRIFNIEWRTRYYNSGSGTANFEVRLYEGQRRFDIIYGTISQNNQAGIGVQGNFGSTFTQYSCDSEPESFGLQLTFREASPPRSNGKIAFSNVLDIFVMNTDGSGRTQLTNNAAGNNFPDWALDGTKIVFSRHSPGALQSG